MEDTNKYEIDSVIKTKEIKDYTLHSWGFFICGMVSRFMREENIFNMHISCHDI